MNLTLAVFSFLTVEKRHKRQHWHQATHYIEQLNYFLKSILLQVV